MKYLFTFLLFIIISVSIANPRLNQKKKSHYYSSVNKKTDTLKKEVENEEQAQPSRNNTCHKTSKQSEGSKVVCEVAINVEVEYSQINVDISLDDMEGLEIDEVESDQDIGNKSGKCQTIQKCSPIFVRGIKKTSCKNTRVCD